MRTLPAIAIYLFVSGTWGQAPNNAEAIRITRSGSQPPRPAPVENFAGSVRIEASFPANAPGRMYGARIAFAPGARTAWHTHPLGQTLIVVSGIGRVQRWGDAVQEIRQGDIVRIPPGQKHWHGAAPDTAMTHWGIGEELDGKGVAWLEKVSDAQYGQK